ncbi:MAG: hypothetical protein ABI072_01025, partial [Edaphobacter sp.]
MIQGILLRSLKQRQNWRFHQIFAILGVLLFSFSSSFLILSASMMADAQGTTIPAGVPLRIEIDHRSPLKIGAQL